MDCSKIAVEDVACLRAPLHESMLGVYGGEGEPRGEDASRGQCIGQFSVVAGRTNRSRFESRLGLSLMIQEEASRIAHVEKS